MKPTEKDIEFIERFIDGDLSEKEIESFENRLKNDTDFAIEYNNRIKLSKLWKEADEYQKTKDEISVLLKNEKTSFFITHRYYIVSVAASIAILLGVYLLFFQTNKGIQMDQQIVQNDSSSANDNVIDFQMDEPTKLATVEVLRNPIDLISPKDNFNFTETDPIVLEWFSSSKDMDTLFVWSKSMNKIIINQAVEQKEDTIRYDIGLLPEGEYSWYFNDTLIKKSFTVYKRK
jgi:hypothetical protein